MSEHRIHRYDLIKSKMIEEDPLSDVRAAVEQALQSDRRVWIVGGARLPIRTCRVWDRPPIRISAGPVTCHFGRLELGSFLNAHAISGNVVLEPMTGREQRRKRSASCRPWLAEIN